MENVSVWFWVYVEAALFMAILLAISTALGVAVVFLLRKITIYFTSLFK